MKTPPIQHELSELMEPRNLIISIKPEYALQIIDGKKTIELRRKFPTENIKGGIAIIYASSPIQKIVGYAFIEDVKKLQLSSLWEKFNKQACVTKKFFNSYFKGVDEGFAISLSNPVKLHPPVDIKTLEGAYSFSPPQSYCYAPERILEAVEA